jgi:predicted O-methyltransferase YrrM
MRALLVGGAVADAERLAARLAPAATVICFAPDRAAAEGVKKAITARARDARVSVMIGDPALLVHKVSGPFDLIALAADARSAAKKQRERLRAMLREDGELDG